MAYNPYLPINYPQPYYGPNPYGYQQMKQQAQQNQAQAQAQQAQRPTVQQGFVLVQSEQEARSYPVAPGNSITFKDESGPFCYVKTMGFSQLDRPTFERYRLVKEEDAQEPVSAPQSGEASGQGSGIAYALQSDVDKLWDELEAVKAKLTAKPTKKTKEVTSDDAD